MAHVAFEHLTFSYPNASRPALVDVTLSIEEGSFVVLCGKSGCGKTTLLRHMKSVLAPHGVVEGRVLYHGEALSRVSELRQSSEIGFVMQDPDAQIVTDKVWHELAFGLENLGVDPCAMRLRVAEMASFFGIEDWFDKDVRDLSGGQKQLLNLASVMAMQPSLLVLDEPTSQLDPIAASDFLNTVSRINQELGTTVVITEHRLEDVFARADYAVVMDEGRIVAGGAPREVGETLLSAGDDMAVALPVPLRVSHAVEGEAACGDAACSAACADVACAPGRASSFGKSPLTIKEGRAWLAGYCQRYAGTFGERFEDGQNDDGQPRGNQPEGARPGASQIEADRFDTDSTEIAIEIKNAWMRYGRDLPDILRGVDLRIPQGSLFAVMGGNGVGKSTLLKVIAGVERAYRGRIRVYGSVAMLPQDPQNLFSKDSVREELEEMVSGFAAAASGHRGAVDRGTDGRRIEEIARLVNVETVLDSHPYDLSGGEQQRVALAKVLLTQPQILLLDEPTKGLDAFFKRTLARILDELTQRGVTILMVSHDVEFCARYAHEVALLFEGAAVTSAPPRQFFAGNGFYTTAASRMSRRIVADAIVEEDLIAFCAEKMVG